MSEYCEYMSRLPAVAFNEWLSIIDDLTARDYDTLVQCHLAYLI